MLQLLSGNFFSRFPIRRACSGFYYEIFIYTLARSRKQQFAVVFVAEQKRRKKLINYSSTLFVCSTHHHKTIQLTCVLSRRRVTQCQLDLGISKSGTGAPSLVSSRVENKNHSKQTKPPNRRALVSRHDRTIKIHSCRPETINKQNKTTIKHNRARKFLILNKFSSVPCNFKTN